MIELGLQPGRVDLKKSRLLNSSLHFCQSLRGFIILTWWPWTCTAQISCWWEHSCHSSRSNTTLLPRACSPSRLLPGNDQAQLVLVLASSNGNFGWGLSTSLSRAVLDLRFFPSNPPPFPFPFHRVTLSTLDPSPLCFTGFPPINLLHPKFHLGFCFLEVPI